MDTIAIEIPESLYSRLEQIAGRLKKPVDHLLVETLEAALGETDKVPSKIQTEVAALDRLDDPELREIAHSEMALPEQEMMGQLLDLQASRPLTETELEQLNQLRNEYGRVLLCKARAFALLAERGYSLPQL